MILRSFKVEAPCRAVHPPSWDLEVVLRYLRSPIFKPLASGSLRDLMRKTLFSSSSAGLSYVSEFLAKTETAVHPLPRSFSFQSLQDFAADLSEDLLLCPVRSLREYLRRTSGFVNRSCRLFVSPRRPSRAMLKNGISYLLREVIVHSGASSEDGVAPRAHSIHGIATSSAFFKNWSISNVLEAAS